MRSRATPRRHLGFVVPPLLSLGITIGCDDASPHGSGGSATGVGTTSSGSFGPGTTGGETCLPSAEGGAAPAPCDTDHPPVSYATDVAPLLAGCAGELCHGPIAAKDLVGVPSSECGDQLLVEVGHPESSYLVSKLRGQRMCCGERMPPNAPPLSDSATAAIVAWICQGAPD
ncbi:MAG: hypothetical protein JNL21_12650 [Myxococcales bacterium]|nr:hypothetical protein [Myxococcales bacterium]